MNSDKQIEDMAKQCFYNVEGYCCLDCQNFILCAENSKCCAIYQTLETLVNADYRLASEVALEVIGKIEKIIGKHYNRHIFGVEELSDVEKEAVMNFSDDVTLDIAELKKKYTEGEE